ncbi:MAG TPA: hypothetical protein VN132_14085 [Bdellovibrio sp.]|nr:hypothetical protein [Bdellovibrio sp.]
MKYFVLTSLLLFCLQGRAATVEEFAQSSLEIVHKLQAQGIHKIGDFDVDQLEKQIMSTKWREMGGVYLIGSGKGRTTSVYFPADQLVVINSLSVQYIDRKTLPHASLHEVLGANGYDDENYRLGLALRALSESPKTGRSLFENIIKNSTLRDLKNKTYKSIDGGTSVGGGGDSTSIDFKYRMLEEAIASSDEKFISRVLEAEVEPNWEFTDSNRSSAQVQYTWKNEHAFVVVPSLWWSVSHVDVSSEEWKTGLVRSVMQKIAEIQ